MQRSTCSTCGAAMNPGGSFCGACGRAAGFAAPPQAYGQPSPQQAAPPQAAPQYAQAQQPQYPQAQQPQYPPPPSSPSQYPPSQFPPPPTSPSPYPPSQFPPPQHQYQQPPYPPPYAPAVAQTEWKWGYSRWIGITYGPIPVGIIVAVIVLLMIYK